MFTLCCYGCVVIVMMLYMSCGTVLWSNTVTCPKYPYLILSYVKLKVPIDLLIQTGL